MDEMQTVRWVHWFDGYATLPEFFCDVVQREDGQWWLATPYWWFGPFATRGEAEITKRQGGKAMRP
jgi:hypothetical protein